MAPGVGVAEEGSIECEATNQLSFRIHVSGISLRISGTSAIFFGGGDGGDDC